MELGRSAYRREKLPGERRPAGAPPTRASATSETFQSMGSLVNVSLRTSLNPALTCLDTCSSLQPRERIRSAMAAILSSRGSEAQEFQLLSFSRQLNVAGLSHHLSGPVGIG